MGGLVPGVIIGCALMITWFFTARKDGLKAEPSTLSSSEKWHIFWQAIPALLLPIFIIFGLRGGIFYPYRSRCNCLCVRAGSGHVYL